MIQVSLRVFALPLFADNYSYILQPGDFSNPLLLIDPANPLVVSNCLTENFKKFKVGHILYTHKHWDHAGGASELIPLIRQFNQSKDFPIQVYAGQQDSQFIPTVTKSISEDRELMINNLPVRVYKVPCHTRGHVIYHFLEKEGGNFEKTFEMKTCEGKKLKYFDCGECAFTGDTLFSGGVGRFFEGNTEEMFKNLNKIHRSLSPICKIFNGHEYTLQNLEWGIQAEPENQKIKKQKQKLSQSEPLTCTLPTSTHKQSEINVFYRAAILDKNPLNLTPVEYLRVLREAKNDNSCDLKKYTKL